MNERGKKNFRKNEFRFEACSLETKHVSSSKFKISQKIHNSLNHKGTKVVGKCVPLVGAVKGAGGEFPLFLVPQLSLVPQFLRIVRALVTFWIS